MRRVFGNLKKNEKEITKYVNEDYKNFYKQFPIFRFMNWYDNEIRYLNNLEVEKMKYKPKSNPYSKYSSLGIILGFILGSTIVIVSEKQKMDDIQVREKGYVEYKDVGLLMILMRYIKMKLHMFIQRNMLLNFKDMKPNLDVTLDDFDMANYKQKILKIDRVNNYFKYRNDTFDFVYLAEKQNFIDV